MHEFHFLERHKGAGSEVKHYKNRAHITESRAIFAAPIRWLVVWGARGTLEPASCILPLRIAVWRPFQRTFLHLFCLCCQWPLAHLAGATGAAVLALLEMLRFLSFPSRSVSWGAVLAGVGLPGSAPLHLPLCQGFCTRTGNISTPLLLNYFCATQRA